jgi:hypothetical protein
VDEDGVELPLEPRGPHVALKVFALGIERAAHGQHLGREVDQRELEAVLEVGRVVAAAAPQLEHSLERIHARFFEDSPVEGSLLGVVGGSRQERPPARERPVEKGSARPHRLRGHPRFSFHNRNPHATA